MSSNFSNKTLAAVFVVLLIVVAAIFIFDGDKNERTFRQELVTIDTSKVTEILIYPKSQNHEEVRLYLDDDNWRVKLSEDKSAPVSSSKIKGLYTQLLSVKPKRLAARGNEKWGEFQVDSTGTRIKVLEDGRQTLDLIFGKFAFQQPRSMSTYVRLGNDSDVYEVDGFIEMSFNQDANSFRNNLLLKDDTNNWQRLSFDYPADSSFQLVKLNDDWFANDQKTDSAATASFLRQLSNASGSNFVDDVNSEILGRPDYKLTIDKQDGNSIVVEGWQTGNNLVMRSNYNDETYFDGTASKLTEKVFVGMSSLIPK